MNRAAVVVSILLVTALALRAQDVPSAQTPGVASAQPPPQSARQALIEIFFGESANHIEKHLPEITKKALSRLDPGSPSLLTEISDIGRQAKAAGGKVQINETGPILMLTQPQPGDKFEVTVERDDLAGDEDQIELTFYFTRKGKIEPFPFIPRVTFMMRMEADVWRLEEPILTARMPLTDPDFLKGFVGQMLEKQQSTNQMMAVTSVRAIIVAETAYHSKHPDKPFTCSLSEAAASAKGDADSENRWPINDELASGTKNGYVFALTGCDSTHYRVAAEPARPSAGRRAFCADQGGEVKFSRNGKAATCLSSGQPISGAVDENSEEGQPVE